jgi:hypothetical protein
MLRRGQPPQVILQKKLVSRAKRHEGSMMDRYERRGREIAGKAETGTGEQTRA